MKKVLNNKWFYLTIIFLFMLVFNFLTPYINDDYQLMFNYTSTKRISSLFDVFSELHHMYFNWGGRVFAHFFAYFFLMFPKWIFNIANSLVYVGNVYLIYLIARGKNKNNYKYLLLIHMIIFLLFPVFGQVFLWLDGSCNYSFTLLVQLFFIYKILNMKDKPNYFIYILISLLAGICNENSSLSLIVFLILYTIYDRSNLKLKIVSLVSLIIGYLFMFLAPGNYVRMEVVGGNTSFFNNIISKLLYLISSFWPIILAITLLVIVFYIKNKDKKLILIFYLSSLIAFFSMIASPQLSIRSFTISVIYMFIIVTTIIFSIKKTNNMRFAFIVFGLVFICLFIPTFKEYCNYSKFMSDRDSFIKKSKEEGKKSIGVKIYNGSNVCVIPSSCDFDDVHNNINDFPNWAISRYYGIEVYGYK